MDKEGGMMPGMQINKKSTFLPQLYVPAPGYKTKITQDKQQELLNWRNSNNKDFLQNCGNSSAFAMQLPVLC